MIKPYFETELGKLYNGDCLEILPEVNEKIDMVLTDPPYGTTACKWDSVIPLDLMWKELRRIIKDNGTIIITSSQPFTTSLIMSNKKMFKYEWIWDKKMVTGVGQVKFKPMKCHENIIVFYNQTPIYNPQKRNVGKPFGKLSVTKSKTVSLKSYDKPNYNVGVGYPKTIIEFSRPNNLSGGGFHPTQKPIVLMEYLIKTYTNEKDIVLDFTIGSGTTAIACERLNRRWIGIEISKEYCDIAVDRIKKETAQYKLDLV